MRIKAGIHWLDYVFVLRPTLFLPVWTVFLAGFISAWTRGAAEFGANRSIWMGFLESPAWLLLILVVFGSIINKTPLFPPDSFKEIYVFLTLALPPFLEIIMSAVTLHVSFWQFIFLVVAILQIIFYFILNYRLILKKDFV